MNHNKLIDSVSAAGKFLNVEPAAALYTVEKAYPILVSEYYLNLITKNNNPEEDPIWRQCMPHSDELIDTNSDFDPLAEQRQMVAPRLIHRYKDRVVLLVTGRCATRCRFCFRKRTWADGEKLQDITDDELDAVIVYLQQHPEVKEVLVSGGDPLMLPIKRLQYILDKLNNLPNIDILRIGSRMPVTAPNLISDELAAMLGNYPSLWFMTHFNHPNEVTELAMTACRKFNSQGIPILNQTVLLAGVNDSVPILEELFRLLIKHRIKPHYLFHVDPVRGVRHFATGIEKGLEILREFRTNVSSLAVPTFAIDLPEGGGKVALQPQYCHNGEYPAVNTNTPIKYEEFLPK